MVEVTTSNGFRIDHEKLAEKFTEITNLSKRQAEVFVLRNVKNWNIPKVAKEIGISNGTVSSYSKRTRQKISEAESLIELKKQYY